MPPIPGEQIESSNFSESTLLRVCVCTSYAADREPRGPRHARALYDCGCVDLTFIDAAPEGHPRQPVRLLDEIPVNWQTLRFAVRGQSWPRWGLSKIRNRIARTAYDMLGTTRTTMLSTRIFAGWKR